jgi:uncharacterized protein (TIGR02391 family)
MRKLHKPPEVEPKVFRSADEIDHGINKLQRRVKELEELDVEIAYQNHTAADDVVESNVRNAIREVFGPNSPEFEEHSYIQIWHGPMFIGMSQSQIIRGKLLGRTHVIGILNGLISRLKEKQEEFQENTTPSPSSYFDRLNIHPRLAEVSRDLFMDGHSWESVFAASKALLNYIKDRSNRHDLDGTALVRTVFTKNHPILAFNTLTDQTDLDEQEGMMHLFEGAVLAIRNPGGHSFPEGTDQRAIEYISLLSLLAYRVQESQYHKRS